MTPIETIKEGVETFVGHLLLTCGNLYNEVGQHITDRVGNNAEKRLIQSQTNLLNSLIEKMEEDKAEFKVSENMELREAYNNALSKQQDDLRDIIKKINE